MRRTAVTLGLLVALGGCGSTHRTAGPDDGLEPTTPRGLAAAVDVHLTGYRVSDWSGARQVVRVRHRPTTALIASATIRDHDHHGHLDVTTFQTTGVVPDGCAASSLLCRRLPDGELLEISAPGRGFLLGTLYSPTRGTVSLSLESAHSAPSFQGLVAEVLSDHHVGTRTTPALNQAGLRLRPFDTSETSIAVSSD